jgi:DNA/RNA endonuclease YhcR with UshA esterase domain
LSHRIAITGQVKAVQFRNPHGLLRVVVAANNGKTAEWEVECSARNLLARRGWKFDAIKIGDKITISGHPHKYLTTHLYMREVILSNGTRFGDPAGKDSALD